MTDTPKLLPCPFCGGEADLSFEHSTKHPNWWKVTCTICGNRTQSNTTHMDRAIAAWNRRHDAAVSAARKEGVTPDQRKHLPDLVSLAMVGFALLKSDRRGSEWSHPAIAAFRVDVEQTLNERRAAALQEAARKWGQP